MCHFLYFFGSTVHLQLSFLLSLFLLFLICFYYLILIIKTLSGLFMTALGIIVGLVIFFNYKFAVKNQTLILVIIKSLMQNKFFIHNNIYFIDFYNCNRRFFLRCLKYSAKKNNLCANNKLVWNDFCTD